MVTEITSPRFSRSRLASAWLAASRSRSIMLSRNTITVRAISPSSSFAVLGGMRDEVSPAASRFMVPTSPSSGRVILRPIHQLKPRPIRTAAQPTHMMMIFVRVCDADNVAEAACARSRADSMILSASGSMRSLEVSMRYAPARS